MITFNTEGMAMPDIDQEKIRQWVEAVAGTYGKRVGEINYIFVDDERILEINRQFLGHDYYTDIITFDYTEGRILSGDLYISLDTVRSNAEQLSSHLSLLPSLSRGGVGVGSASHLPLRSRYSLATPSAFSPLTSHYQSELHRVVIHGVLHLCGINDKGPGEREIMEAAENKALHELLHTQ